MSELLRQLHTYDHVDLPKDARTLLGTPRINPVEILASGERAERQRHEEKIAKMKEEHLKEMNYI